MGWVQGEVTVEELNLKSQGCLNEHLGIEITELTETSIKGRMPVDGRTTQPAGMLHGGASVAFAETLASWGAHCAIDRSAQHAVGLEINANHVRPVPSGTWVYGEGTPLTRGRTTHVWDIRITDENGRPVCISRCTMAVIAVASQYVRADQRSTPPSA